MKLKMTGLMQGYEDHSGRRQSHDDVHRSEYGVVEVNYRAGLTDLRPAAGARSGRHHSG